VWHGGQEMQERNGDSLELLVSRPRWWERVVRICKKNTIFRQDPENFGILACSLHNQRKRDTFLYMHPNLNVT